MRIEQLQKQIKEAKSIQINSQFLDYSGVIEYYPEELVITVKAGTPISEIKKILAKNNQVLTFYTDDNKSIGSAYATGNAKLADSVLGVQLIDGRGDVLNFGGQVMKNVAGYDVSRLLVGSKGRLALITQISFKVMPITYVGELSAPKTQNNTSKLRMEIEQKLKTVFDPKGIFQ
jgi:glycolate oxidase FAD binding subunit